MTRKQLINLSKNIDGALKGWGHKKKIQKVSKDIDSILAKK